MKLRYGYLISGIVTGLLLMFGFVWSLPDGKLHITFCDVGQGDAAYIRFPDGRDMLVDGGPGNTVLTCLGKHMPFWDRHIDMVLATHAEKDHIGGLVPVLSRYRVDLVIRSSVGKDSDIYDALVSAIREHGIREQLVSAGQSARVGRVTLSVLWPSAEQVAAISRADVLGAVTGSVNEVAVVCRVRYGSFDALLTGDAETAVETAYAGSVLADDHIEVLKVPHHGSPTGMTSDYLDRINPDLAVISVGRNSYGHPGASILKMLADHHVQVLRTDEEGDIEIVSDGMHWSLD